MKKTLVFGASLKPNRYSNLAVHKLVDQNIETEAFGINGGQIRGVLIRTKVSDFKKIHTITLYIGAKRQVEYYDSFLKIKPKRVIFNPGTENPELYKILENNNIAIEIACTLVLLSTNQY